MQELNALSRVFSLADCDNIRATECLIGHLRKGEQVSEKKKS